MKYKGTIESVKQNGNNGIHTLEGKCVALTYNNEFRTEDAKTIADAINVRQKIPFDLPELLERYEAMKDLISDINNLKRYFPNWNDWTEVLDDYFEDDDGEVVKYYEIQELLNKYNNE